jgi:DNA-binding transcriptional LysR family regulator
LRAITSAASKRSVSLENASEEVRGFADRVTGDLRIGLMPTMTRAALAPTLEQFVPRIPTYGCTSSKDTAGCSPTWCSRTSSTSPWCRRSKAAWAQIASHRARPRDAGVEPAARFAPLAPVRLAGLRSAQIVVPPPNVRRRNIEIYLQTHGVEVADMMEMDAMIALDFRGASDWVAILSGLICVRDIDSVKRVINPIFDPPLFAEFVVISPSRRTLSTQARLFLELFEAEIENIQAVWARIIPPAVFPETSAQRAVTRLRVAKG